MQSQHGVEEDVLLRAASPCLCSRGSTGTGAAHEIRDTAMQHGDVRPLHVAGECVCEHTRACCERLHECSRTHGTRAACIVRPGSDGRERTAGQESSGAGRAGCWGFGGVGGGEREGLTLLANS